MPVITKGAKAAEEISDANKKSGRTRVKQLVIKDGETYVVHFVTEITELITADVHQFVDTKAKPDGWPGDNYPKSMWAVCQRDRMFRVRDEAGNLTDAYEEGYGDCYIHAALVGKKDRFGKDSSLPASQTYGLAVVRKPVEDPATGSVVGFTDELVEFKAEDGTVYQLPKLVLISQKFSNFWHPVSATAYVAPHTILDKDFVIRRKEKEYSVAVIATTPDCKPGTASFGKYEEALKLMGFDLAEFILDHATPDHYARFFIPGVDPAGGYGRKGDDEESDDAAGTANGSDAASSPAAPVVDQDALADFRASLKNRGETANT